MSWVAAILATAISFVLGVILGAQRCLPDVDEQMSASEWRRAYFVLADISIRAVER